MKTNATRKLRMNIQEVSFNVACMVPNIRLNQFVSF